MREFKYWWDFLWKNNEVIGVIVQTDNPKLDDVNGVVTQVKDVMLAETVINNLKSGRKTLKDYGF